MPSTEEPRKSSTISSQIFDLLKVGITLALTGLIGGGITYYYQERAHRAQQEQADLATARQSALTFLREIGDILEQRRHFALRVLDTIQENAPPEERDQVWKDYMNAVNAWNVKWNLYRALVLEQFGPEMQKRFYDEKADSETTWAKFSITGKLMSSTMRSRNCITQRRANRLPMPRRCESFIRLFRRTPTASIRRSSPGYRRAESASTRGQRAILKATIATLVEPGNFRLS